MNATSELISSHDDEISLEPALEFEPSLVSTSQEEETIESIEEYMNTIFSGEITNAKLGKVTQLQAVNDSSKPNETNSEASSRSSSDEELEGEVFDFKFIEEIDTTRFKTFRENSLAIRQNKKSTMPEPITIPSKKVIFLPGKQHTTWAANELMELYDQDMDSYLHS